MKNNAKAYWLGKKRPEHSKKMTGKHWKQCSNSGNRFHRQRKEFAELGNKAKIWRVKEKYGLRPANCQECNEPGVIRHGRYSIHYVNVDGHYQSDDISQWKMLCPKCEYAFLLRRGVRTLNS